jgi:carboxyl-terminal processing protease
MRITIWILSIALFLSACKKTIISDSGIVNTNTVTSDSAANTWIYSTMKDYYLWSDSMPNINTTNINSKPTSYFYTILNNYGTTDRFSWIDSSATNLTNQLNGINTVLGIKYNAFYADLTNTNVVFVIAYVLKGSAAEKLGLKRGDIIMKVDGQNITTSNYTSILQNQNLKLELGSFNNNLFTSNGTILSITKTELQTNPILKDTIIEWGGKKVGYLNYVQFLTSFDDSLKSIFTKFKNYKTTGIDELVLDLRYNGGGYVTSSDLLTNLIVKDLTGKIGNAAIIMNQKIYNAAYTAVLKKENQPTDFVTNFQFQAANISTLNRVFILTSNNTASASELVINNLKPFMNVILIGEHTYGKNVGSFTITDSKKRWDFGLQPITFKIANSKGESNYGTVNGFTPDYALLDNVMPYKQLGDPAETYLSQALALISGVAYKSAGLDKIVKLKRIQVQNLPIGDNINMDKKDMFIKQQH